MSLKATIELVDKVSDRFNTMATTGKAALSDIQQYSSSASTAYDKLSKVISQSDIDSIEKSCNAAGTSLKDMRDSTLEWTDAASNYNKEALEMMNTDEELVEQGLKIKSAVAEAADSVEDMGETAKSTTDDVKGLGEEVERTSEETEGFGDKSKTAIGDLDQIIASAGIVTGLKQIADGFKECADNSEELESMTAKLETISGSSVVGGLASEVKQLSSETGKYATDLTDVAYNAISAGTAVEESVNMAKTASELATAGFTNEASALSVLETAMNSYGDQIESVSDVSDSLITVQNLGVTTVDQLAAQMGKAISTAAAYNVSLGNVESGYISITKAGINTAEGTTYLSGMLNELGNTGSEIGKVLKEETGQSFGQLMNEGQSLADVLGIVYDRVGRNSEAMINMFGSQEAGKAAMAIINQGLDQFNNNLEAVENSTGATASAYAIMADTTEFAHNRMNNSAKNLSIVIGDQLNSSLKDVYSVTADIFDMVGTGLEKAPAVTALLTGATVGVAALTIGVTAYNAVTKYGTVVQTAFNAAMNANPIFWIVPVITGVVTAAGVLINVMEDANEEYNSLTAASKEQYKELQSLQTQYDEVAEKEGETSDKAIELATSIEIATNKFETNRMTIEEWNQIVDSTIQKHDDLISKSNDIIQSHAIEGQVVSNLVDRMSELSLKTNRTATENTELGIVVDLLNDKVKDLNLVFDSQSGKINKSADAIKQYYNAINAAETYDKAKDNISELQDQLGNEELQVKVAEKQVADAQKLYDEAEAAYAEHCAQMAQSGGQVGIFDHLIFTKDEKNELDDAKAKLEELQGIVDETKGKIEDVAAVQADAFMQLSDGSVAQDTFCEAISATNGEVTALIESYQEAYTAAYESFSGQYGIFDEASANLDATVSNAQKALDSQLAYWDAYASNISTLKNTSAEDLGITQENYDALMTYVQDGSAEAAGLAKSMVDNINQGNTEAVAKLANTAAAVQEKESEAAKEVADFQTDFSKKMDEVVAKTEDTVSKMDVSQEAKNAATRMITAYAESIKANSYRATNAAGAVADATSAALSGGGTASPSIPKHAKGTTNAESVFIAGDDYGPELVVDHAGSTVFPHSETMKIVEAVGEMYYDAPSTEMMPYYTAPVVNTSSPAQSTEKTIHIDINGSGKMSFSGNIDESQVIEILQKNLTNVMLNIVSEEIAEEGDDSYEY